MLAHKAVHEAHVAAEVIAGELQGNKELAAAAFNARVIPSVAYTDPEVAWVGLTEDEAKAKGIAVKKGLFPWTASGRAIAPAGASTGSGEALDKRDGGAAFGGYDVTGAVELPADKEMVMPGDNVSITVKLINPIAMEEGLRFAIREGGRTVGAGVVAKIIA